MLARLKIIDALLEKGFRWLGGQIGRRPWPFIAIPFILTIVMASGFLNVEYVSDPDYLCSPVNGQGWKEKALAEKFFPTNFSDFDVPRSTRYGMFGYVMVTAKDGKSILQPQIWSEVRQLQNIIVNVTVERKGEVFTYEEICAKWAGECYTNGYLTFADTFAVLSKGIFRESIENYYHRYSGKIGFDVASDISQLSINTSKDINEYVKRIKLLTNRTIIDIKTNLDVISSAVVGFQKLTTDIIKKYRTQLEPAFVGIPLPAYFGGITLKNHSLNNIDPCEVISFLKRNSTNPRPNEPCLHPQEILSAIKDFYYHAEEDVISTRVVLHKLNRDVKMALNNLNLRTSARTLIGLLSNVSASLQEFATKVNTVVGDTDNLNVDNLLKAEAVLIGGLLNSEKYFDIGEEWEKKFLQTINLHASKFTTINIAPLVSNSLKFEMIESVSKLKPILIANISLMILFCMAVCFTKDITTSKPWIGFAGLVSTLFGTASAFGLLVFLGAEFTNFNYGAVFILVGIGLDDTFVVLNSWHRTDRKAPVEERMADTLSESGVSILITSLTDILSFFTAISAPYPYVKIFCLYTGLSLLFVFLWHITFFAAWLALAGRAEENGRSGFTLREVQEDDKHQQCLCLRMESYQVNESQTDAEKKKMSKERKETIASLLGMLLSSGVFRVTVMFLYAGYICLSIYGIQHTRVEFDRTKLINYDSSMKHFVDVEDRLFQDKSYLINVIVSGNINYTDEKSRDKIIQLLTDLGETRFVNNHLTKSWLTDFKHVEIVQKLFTNKSEQTQSEKEFAMAVHKFYENKDTPYRLDIKFNDDISRILASRFLIQGQNIRGEEDEKAMVTELRDICNKFTDDDVKATVFNSYFIYLDQYLSIFEQTLQTLLMTGAIVIIISILLLPNITSAISSILSIVSTLLGTFGFMSLWDIALDGITLINLVMCIGFSVDFSAHFCYHYMKYFDQNIVSKQQIVERTLMSVTKPVLQGAASTLLGVIGMIFAPSYSFIIFFKMILIVIGLGVVHSLILVPVFLKFILDLKDCFKIKSNKNCDEEYQHKNLDKVSYMNPVLDVSTHHVVTHM